MTKSGLLIFAATLIAAPPIAIEASSPALAQDASSGPATTKNVYRRVYKKQQSQLTNIDLQPALQKQQQSVRTMSNTSKTTHDTLMGLIRKIGG
jgi:hypothetical protein